MSSRQIRKLQKQKDLEKAQEILEQGSDESDGYERPAPAKPRVSLFAALGGASDDDDQDGPQDEDEHEAEAESQPVKEEVEEPKPAGGKSKRKKKKKKKAKSTMTVAGADANNVEEDEIDKAMKELNIKPEANIALSSTTNTAALASVNCRGNELVAINTYHLKAMNEMRALFGQEIIESASAEEAQEALNRQRRGNIERQVDLETFLRGRPGQPKLPEVSLRRNIFIQGREHWPRHSVMGLTMKEIEKAEDGSWIQYAYFHEGEYEAAQSLFFTLVNMGDPMRMVDLLTRAPYHVSTLLQVSSVAKQDQNMALAAELCERALFSFGRVTSSAFKQNLEQGRARLDFCRPENRQFWLAGYHYIKSLIRKGTYRTALEWSKLLYMLDTHDPYAMRHFIHVFAIRAHEAKWLVDFIEELEGPSEKADSMYLRQSLVLAKLQMGDHEGARAALDVGMKQVPWLYCALFQELNLDTPPSIWGINPDTDERSFWVKLYIHQAKDLWNNSQAIGLLQTVAKGLDKVDTSKLPARDEPPDLGATRFVYLDGQTSIITHAPREYLERLPNYEFDPLPPPVEENVFTSYATEMPFLETPQNQPQTSGNQARLRNMLAQLVAPMAGGIAGQQDADENDEETLRELLDDEELQRDIQEQARGGDGTGILATLMQLLGGGFGGQSEGNTNDEEEDNAPVQDEQVEQSQDLPGAWPSDDETEHSGHR